jgi:hypothetical protein
MLRFHLLGVSIGQLADEVFFISAFSPCLSDLSADRASRSAELVSQRVHLVSGKRLRELNTACDTSRAFLYTRKSLKLLA